MVAEEFGDWEDARRRVDLLAIHRSGQLVVIELKRTEDGGHMELQALRYAAMVSAMGFEQVVDTYAKYLSSAGDSTVAGAARRRLLEWLGVDDDSEEAPAIASQVRILLVSLDFGRELTTTVLWLNDQYGLDVRCIRLTPYEVAGRILLDVRQVIPLPEARDYQVRLRRKEQEQERALREGRDFTRYHIVVDGVERPDTNKRRSILSMVQELVAKGVAVADVAGLLSNRHVAVVGGVLTERDAVEASMVEQGRAPDRFVLEEALHADGKTYIVSKMWGSGTADTLMRLSKAFPDAGVTFREAEE